MGQVDVGEAKRSLRRDLLALRRGLHPSEVARASAAVTTRLAQLPELSGPVSVLAYAADPDEITLDALLAAPPDGWRLFLPRVEHGEVVVVPHRAGSPLRIGHRGIREPDGTPVDASVLDVVLVPGVAFSPAGVRLGRGAGMYDRLLPRTDGAVRVGVCSETFVRDEVPAEAHDVPVDVLVTDASVRRRAAASGAGCA